MLVAVGLFSVAIAGGAIAVLASDDDAGTEPEPTSTSAAPATAPAPTPSAPTPAQPTVAEDGVIETSKATDPLPSAADQAARQARQNELAKQATAKVERAGLGDLKQPPAQPVPGDTTSPEELRAKKNKIRMNNVVDKYACANPDAKARVAQMSQEDQEAFAKRCAKFKKEPPPTPPAKR
jgi:hypothetical protein